MGLFGYAEQAIIGESPMVQWSRVLRRYAEERTDALRGCAPAHCHLREWLTALDALRGQPQDIQLAAVNSYINLFPYIEDTATYGVVDYWAAPGEFFHRGGDCEDFAIAKFLSLRELGFPSGSLRLVVVTDLRVAEVHVVVVFDSVTGPLVLDNKAPDVRSAATIDYYVPIVSLSEQMWWIHAPAMQLLETANVPLGGPLAAGR